MKRYFFAKIICMITTFTLLLLLFTPLGGKVAFSDSFSYLRVEKDGVYLYSNETLDSASLLFEIPKTYYLKILERGNYATFVEYGNAESGYSKIVGYVRTEDVKEREGISPLFPKTTLTAIENTSILKSPSENSLAILALFSGQKVNLYGFSKSREYLFVSVSNNFGYVRANAFESFRISEHPLPLPAITPTKTPAPSPSDAPTEGLPLENGELPQGIQILLLVFIAIPVLIITILLFVPRRNRKENNRYG